MARRGPEFDLERAIESVSFTPGARDVPPLFAMLDGDEAHAERAERALLRMGAAAGRAAIADFSSARAPRRGRLCRLVGQLAARSGGDPEIERTFVQFLLERLADEDPKARRNAIIALGKVPGDEHREAIEDALVGGWERESRVDHRRSLAAALGKRGGDRARALLAGARSDDPELARILDEARLVLERAPSADEREAGIDAARSAPRPLALVLRCRVGLERLLAEEAAPRFKTCVHAAGEVRTELAGPLASVFALRTMLSFGFLVPAEKLDGDGDGALAAAAARAITSAAAAEVFGAFSVGGVRYRVDFPGRGRRRAEVFRVAGLVAARRPELINDPVRRNWEVLIAATSTVGKVPAVELELRPRLPDARFAYRLGDVPAASHPTLAAALVRVAGARDDDVVWDPFVGSGTELAERALAGRYASLHGSDHDPRALEAARVNLEAATHATLEHARIFLKVGDALAAPPPPGLTLVITNPPMGRRVMRHEELGGFFDRFIDRMASGLAPGGRLAWISPLPGRTAARAAHDGLVVGYRQRVDMGGFDGEIQLLRREKRARR